MSDSTLEFDESAYGLLGMRKGADDHASFSSLGAAVRSGLLTEHSFSDKRIMSIVERSRPPALRDFDQIPMRPADLVWQARMIAPQLAGKAVAFVGDYDGASLVLGLIGHLEGGLPSSMLVLDFDERVLANARRVADQHGFGAILTTRLHNVLEPIPADLAGRFEWFYTNPPYGSCNEGASAKVFVARGVELVRPLGGRGCLILPDDPTQPWTRVVTLTNQRFLLDLGWTIREKLNGLHRYHLDDDPGLTSTLTITEHCGGATSLNAGDVLRRAVPFAMIPNFYGRSVDAPYPRSIRADGSYRYDWPKEMLTGG